MAKQQRLSTSATSENCVVLAGTHIGQNIGDVNSREDALKAYQRTRLKLLAWAPSDEDGN